MPKNREKPRVLMVDDDADFRSIVGDWLAPRYEFIGMSRGEDLLPALAGIEPDLVILDVLMPGPDGFQLCGRIRSDARFTGLPVLFLTGCREDDDFFKSLDAGATAYLAKPVAQRELLSMLREMIPTVAA